MHRFSSIHSLRRFRVAMLLLFAKCLLAPCAVGVLLYGMILRQEEVLWLAAWLCGGTVATAILQWMFASRVNCPLCMVPVLANRTCTKHRNSRKFLGSYRLQVATSAFFKGYFRCPYCNEPTALEVRERHKPRRKKR